MHQNMNQTMLVAHLVAHMLRGTEQFADSVVGLPVPEIPTCLNDDRVQWAESALLEEVQEFVNASKIGDVVEAADGLIDLVYFALGRLVEMGVPALAVFDAVQQANMEKVRGELSKRPGAQGFDAIKPEGWQPPNHAWLVEVNGDTVAKAAKWDAMSPVLKRVVEVRAAKGADYNSVVDLRDYFPFGHFSYAQMIHVKTLRIRALVGSGGTPKHEAVVDTVEDLINYATYYAEAIDQGLIPSTTSGAKA